MSETLDEQSTSDLFDVLHDGIPRNGHPIYRIEQTGHGIEKKIGALDERRLGRALDILDRRSSGVISGLVVVESCRPFAAAEVAQPVDLSRVNRIIGFLEGRDRIKGPNTRIVPMRSPRVESPEVSEAA